MSNVGRGKDENYEENAYDSSSALRTAVIDDEDIDFVEVGLDNDKKRR